MEKVKFACPCLFGLESILADEIKKIGGMDVVVDNGRVIFTGGLEMLTKANLWLRTAERVLIVMGEFRATTFEELFEGVRRLPFENYIGKSNAFPVKGWSLNSKLESIPACQSIIKKAVVRRMESAYHQAWFEETGDPVQIQFSIHKDRAAIYLDTSGAGLHKRGYRRISNDAPIKETLAAGIVSLARMYDDSTVYDPFCGSGTFVIESALQALNIAPGINRHFAFEKWNIFQPTKYRQIRQEALESIHRKADFIAFASDIDPECVQLTVENAKKAGVISKIRAEVKDIRNFATTTERGKIITNPPYGERLLNLQEAEELYRVMGHVFERRPGFSFYIISPDEQFESLFGAVADRRRKLYNGDIRCQLYMYFRSKKTDIL